MKPNVIWLEGHDLDMQLSHGWRKREDSRTNPWHAVVACIVNKANTVGWDGNPLDGFVLDQEGYAVTDLARFRKEKDLKENFARLGGH